MVERWLAQFLSAVGILQFLYKVWPLMYQGEIPSLSLFSCCDICTDDKKKMPKAELQLKYNISPKKKIVQIKKELLLQ